MKGIKDSTRTRTNQSAKSNLIAEKLQSEVDIERKQGSVWPSLYYYLINGKRIDEAIFPEMDNVISIIMDNIKYLEAWQLSKMKETPDRSPTWSKPANTNFWAIDKP